MDWEGKVATARLTCAVTGRLLGPGELVYSGLVYTEGGFSRRDFCHDGWEATDRTAVLSWWRRTIPRPEENTKALRLDKETLFTIFSDLKGATVRPQQCFCYVIALCLMRLKRLKFIMIEQRESQSWMQLEDRINRVVYRLRDPLMTPAEQAAVQDQFMAVVGAGLVAVPTAAPGPSDTTRDSRGPTS